MKNIITIFKKEFYRVMSDRRLIFTAIFLPGLAIYVMYSFMGNAIGNEVEDIESHTIIVYTEHMPDSYKTLLESTDRTFEYHDYDASMKEDVEAQIMEGTIDILMIFPEDLEATLLDYENPDFTVPVIDTYFNSGERYSNNAYGVVNYTFNRYREEIWLTRFGEDIYVFTTNYENIVNEQRATGQGFAQLLPMLIIMFLFSGAMSIGPDSIAGEKERGTIATLLVTPIKRSEVAIGKVLSLSVISLMSATSSFVGIMLSLPKLMQGQELDTNIYGIGEYISILVVLLATVLLIVGLVSMISAYAKSIKEASMLILPLYFIAIIVGVSTMMNSGAAENPMTYAIPLYNSVNMLIGILTFDIVPVHFVIMVVSNLVYVILLVLVINRLFESEKVMFSK